MGKKDILKILDWSCYSTILVGVVFVIMFEIKLDFLILKYSILLFGLGLILLLALSVTKIVFAFLYDREVKNNIDKIILNSKNKNENSVDMIENPEFAIESDSELKNNNDLDNSIEMIEAENSDENNSNVSKISNDKNETTEELENLNSIKDFQMSKKEKIWAIAKSCLMFVVCCWMFYMYFKIN